MSAHAKLSPSASSRWLVCPGSIRLSENVEDKGNAAANRGTLIHKIGEDLLNGIEHHVGEMIACDEKELRTAIDNEMLNEAKAYAEYVRNLVKPGDELIVEMKVDLTHIAPETFGHADSVVIDIENEILHVVDLKTGRQPVSAEQNTQLMLYAAGAYEEFNMFYGISTVRLHIVQDNSSVSNTNSWELSAEELEEFAEFAKERAAEALSDNAPCVPGETQCRYCPAVEKCPALMKEIEKAFEDIEEGSDGEPEETPTTERMAELVARKKLIDIAIARYEQYLLEAIMNGNKVPGFKVVRKQTRKRWVNEIEAFEKLRRWGPLDEIAPRKLITPTQAEKIVLGKDASTKKKNIFNSLWEKPEGSLTLAPESDKRPPVEPVKFDDDDDI